MAALCGALTLTSCAANAVCSLLTSCCCSLTKGRAGNHISLRAAKGLYLGMLTVSAIFALVLYNYGDRITFLTQIPVLRDICENSHASSAGSLTSQCYGASAVLRISLACAIFFGANVLMGIWEGGFLGCWGVKTLVWLATIAGCFFAPADAMAKYATASRVFSILFIIAMVVLLIDFAYHMQEWLGEKMDAEDAVLSEKYEVGLCQNKWRVMYLALAVIGTAASIGGIIALYYFSANRPNGVNCNQNIGFISGTLVMGMMVLVASPLEFCGGRGIVTPSLVFAYCTWLCWSAIDSQPDAACNPTPPDASNTGATIAGMVVAALSLAWTAFSASRSLPTLFHSTLTAQKVDLAAERAAAEEAHQRDHDAYEAAHTPTAGLADALSAGLPKGDGASTSLLKGPRIPARDAEAGHATSYDTEPHHHSGSSSTRGASATQAAEATGYSVLDALIFFFILSLASLYMGQVLTNWVGNPDDIVGSRQSPATMWINIGTQWATFAVYAWTLLAPILFPDRDFS